MTAEYRGRPQEPQDVGDHLTTPAPVSGDAECAVVALRAAREAGWHDSPNPRRWRPGECRGLPW